MKTRKTIAKKAVKNTVAKKPTPKKPTDKKAVKKPVKKADKTLVKNKVFNVSGHNILERTEGRKKVYEVYQNGKFIDKANSLYGAEHIADARYSNQSKKDIKPAKPLAKNEIYVRGDGVQMKIYKRIPKGWGLTEGATAAPKGYKIIDNKKSLFAKNEKDKRKHGLIETEQHKKLTKQEKDKCHGGKPITIIKRSGKKVTYGKVKKAGKTK